MKLKNTVCVLMLLVFASGSSLGQECSCWTCAGHQNRGEEWQKFWAQYRQHRTDSETDQGLGPTEGVSGQIVFLDFDTGNDGSIDYTPERRDAIQTQMQGIYDPFDVTFTQTEPTSGDYSTIIFNEGSSGGVAEDIDFRNLNKNDNAVVNISGLGIAPANFVPASAVIGSHELGHLLGFRHADMFGPIGSGILPGFANFYSPSYPGPTGANESFDHIMTTPAFGASIDDLFTPSWLSERTVIKLKFAESGSAITEAVGNNDSITNAQAISLANLTVPNKIQVGENAGIGDFSFDVAVVVGNLTGNSDTIDYYSFEGQSGDLINMEAISEIPDRYNGNSINSTISVFHSNGDFVDYFGGDAFNNDEIKSSESLLYDLTLSSDDTYHVAVSANSANDSGAYELYITRFNGAADDVLLGDVNCDGEIDLLDVAPFVDLISNGSFFDKADINQDGKVDLLDVAPFVGLINGK